jgi:hypothetical protein
MYVEACHNWLLFKSSFRAYNYLINEESLLKKKIFSILFILMILLVAVGYGVTQYTYSRGVRSGKLVKLSKKGLLLKTYEGTLDLGSGDQLTWTFSVHDNELGEQLVAQTGRKVRLEYRELLFKLFYVTKYDVEAWSLEGDSLDLDYLCRLVNYIRDNASIVNYLRPIIERQDAELLEKIKSCQK